MGKIRTSEDLEKLFKENRERRERQIQKEKERKKKEQDKLQQLKKLQAPILKQIQRLRAIKKQQDEQQQALTKKCSQKASNEATESSKPSFKTYSIYRSNLIERNTSENDLYQSREELMAAEDRGEGKINWSKFDQLVNDTKKMLGL